MKKPGKVPGLLAGFLDVVVVSRTGAGCGWACSERGSLEPAGFVPVQVGFFGWLVVRPVLGGPVGDAF